MKVYFIIIYEKDEKSVIKEIKRIFEKDIWEFIQENRNELFAIYEGRCVLDWS